MCVLDRMCMTAYFVKLCCFISWVFFFGHILGLCISLGFVLRVRRRCHVGSSGGSARAPAFKHPPTIPGFYDLCVVVSMICAFRIHFARWYLCNMRVSCRNAWLFVSCDQYPVSDIGYYARACPTMGSVLVVPLFSLPHVGAHAEDGQIRAEAFGPNLMFTPFLVL